MNLVEVQSRRQWRAWLGQHHASSPGVWLVFHKTHTEVPSVPYEDSVREALCFGWIDSLIKRLDDDRYARKFTPRKAGSKWSSLNRRRWAELQAAGLLTEAGLTAAPTDRDGDAPKLDTPDVLAGDFAAALKKSAKAWAVFEKLAPSHRRHYQIWIEAAKRAETREKRIREAVAMLAAGQKLGLK
jgi:uncharacterized protein YdeI (YjbR/CyaY-like superfamily)